MNEGKIVVGVDIGTSKIVTVITKVDEAVNVLGVSEVKAGGIKKGQIVNIEEAVISINNSIEAAERMAGVSVSRIVSSISGSNIESQNSRGVVAVAQPEGEITGNDVARVIDAAKAVSLPSTREILHVLPRTYIVDGQEGIKDPAGMTGIRLEVETHIVTAGSPAIRNLEKAFSEVGVDVDGIVFSGYASGLATLSDTEKELGVVLVDVGAGTTDISIYIDGSVAYSSVLPIGARHITNDLAIGLRISLESAEKVKLFLSNPQKKQTIIRPEGTTAEEVKKDRSDEIDLSHLGLPEQLNRVSQKTLIEGIIRPRLNEIFTMVGLEIKKSGFGGQTPAGLVITGGGARTVGAVEAAKRMLAMPVRIGIPENIKGIIDEIQDTSYATVVGLAVYGSGMDGGQSGLLQGISIPQFSGIKFGKLPKKFIDLIKSFIP
ncbi:MAG: cell division protein FtsA [Candidatus Levybacteria bacterium]|nr:cell division protein FtsA [Candidatus Levybacteria bacterium]MBI4098270.1 cell division protein FtsA [Candidatus Levybacteria bacterium]